MGAPDNNEILSVMGTTVRVEIKDPAAQLHLFGVELLLAEAQTIERVIASCPFGAGRSHRVWLRSLSTDGVLRSCLLRVTADGRRTEHAVHISESTYAKFEYVFNVFALDWELIPGRPMGVEEYVV